MAERGLRGPFFMKGYFGHPSVTCEMMSEGQRIEYRSTYKQLMRSFGSKGYKSKMKARATLRSILYAELGIKDRLR